MTKVTNNLEKKATDSDFLIHIFIPISASALVLTAKGLHLKKNLAKGLLTSPRGEMESLLNLGSTYALQFDVKSADEVVSVNTKGALMELCPLEKNWTLSFSLPEDSDLMFVQ